MAFMEFLLSTLWVVSRHRVLISIWSLRNPDAVQMRTLWHWLCLDASSGHTSLHFQAESRADKQALRGIRIYLNWSTSTWKKYLHLPVEMYCGFSVGFTKCNNFLC